MFPHIRRSRNSPGTQCLMLLCVLPPTQFWNTATFILAYCASRLPMYIYCCISLSSSLFLQILKWKLWCSCGFQCDRCSFRFKKWCVKSVVLGLPSQGRKTNVLQIPSFVTFQSGWMSKSAETKLPIKWEPRGILTLFNVYLFCNWLTEALQNERRFILENAAT